MANPRRQAIAWAAVSLVSVWTLAGAGHYLSGRSMVTAEKVASYLHETDLMALSGEPRAKAIDRLARQMTALSVEERRRARMDVAWERWFDAMTEAEKSAFLEATMPRGVRQLLASFEELPEEKRQKAVSDALRDLKRGREAEAGENKARILHIDPNRPSPLSEALQQQVVKIGLKKFYSASSAPPPPPPPPPPPLPNIITILSP